MAPGRAGTQAAPRSDSPVLGAISLGGHWGPSSALSQHRVGSSLSKQNQLQQGCRLDSCLQLQASLEHLLLSYWRGRAAEASQRHLEGSLLLTQDTANPGSLVGKATSWIPGLFLPCEQGRVVSRCRGDLTWHRCKDAIKGALHRRPQTMEIRLGGQESLIKVPQDHTPDSSEEDSSLPLPESRGSWQSVGFLGSQAHHPNSHLIITSLSPLCACLCVFSTQ